jgi:hypothetical protein
MKKILITTLLLTSCSSGLSIYKPITGKHFSPRSNGKDWNEDYTKSIGFGYRHKSGLGASYVYADENSIGNNSNYFHAEYIPQVWSKNDYTLSLGGALGKRSGYQKKALGRTNDDYILSGNLQGELCRGNYCSVLQLVPYTNGVAILGIKYKF